MTEDELAQLTGKPFRQLTDEELEVLIDALYRDRLAPRIDGLPFTPENVGSLLALSECRRCGRCCRPDKNIPGHPGIYVTDSELQTISRKTRHDLKSLKRTAKVSNDPSHNAGSRYLPLPCLFSNKNDKSCKIYPFRPLVCRGYPISNCESGEITISLRCDYGKDIFRKLVRKMRKESLPSRTLYRFRSFFLKF